MRIEDFYEVADTVALLAGGPRAGERVRVPDGHDQLLVPPVRLGAVFCEGARYSWTGLILDDGTRVFAAVPA